jgi:hypothetical protein
MANTVLIQEPDAVITLDLAQSVMDIWPDADIILCRKIGQALSRLADGLTPDVLILHISQGRAVDLALGRLVNPDAKVVLTSSDLGAARVSGSSLPSTNWHALEMPFSEAQLKAVLAGPRVMLANCRKSDCNTLVLG